ncbi:MAG TPA: AraC family transcriptional regulator [Pyrinomonadaceae bacterium]|nr:AraC family transcriptional regulator [Pyrinomonadaceae bacterium]
MQLDFFNPRSILCFIAILQGLIFAFLLIKRGFSQKSKADLLLAGLLLSLCSALVTPFIGFANVYDLNQWLTYFPFSIVYVYGVLVWLYTLNLTDSKREFRAKDLILFVPTFLYLAFRFFLFAHDLEWKDWFGDNYGKLFNNFVFVTELVWNLTFLYFSIRHYRKYRAWLVENYSDTEKLKFDWLRNFLYLFSAILLIGAVFDFTNSFVFKLSYIQFFYFEIILALTTYYLAVAGYLRSKTIELHFTEKEAETIEERKMLLAEKELEKLKEKLENLMRKEKIYLEPNLTLNDLSRRLGVNSSVLSYAINNGFGKNFNDFVNEFRIGDVKEKLKNSDDSLLNIAFDCGFNSKATFNRAFKKFTGVSPKEFVSNQ